MKKFMALLLALVMGLSLAACGSTPAGDEDADSETADAVEDSIDGGEKVELYREELDGNSQIVVRGAYAIYYPNREGQRPSIEVYKYYELKDNNTLTELVFHYTPVYDEQGVLVTETLIREGYDEGGNSTQTYVETNTYNPDGSYTRTVVKEATGELRETYTFDSAGRMTSWEHLSGAWYECTYDEQGHTASERAFSVGKEAWTGESYIDYTYNASSNTSTGTYYYNYLLSDTGDIFAMNDEVTLLYDGEARVVRKGGSPKILGGSYAFSEDGKFLKLFSFDETSSCSYDESGMIAIVTDLEFDNHSIYFFDAANNMFGINIQGNYRGIISFGYLMG